MLHILPVTGMTVVPTTDDAAAALAAAVADE